MIKHEKKIGISIYPEKVGEEETIKYVKDSAAAGLKRIFANLLNVKDNEEGRRHIAMQTRVFKIAKDLGFEIILDVNPNVYKEFGIETTDLTFFKNMNVSGIRLDLDFGGKVEAELSNNKLGMKIELNASWTTKTIDSAIKHGANLENLTACHNFYPMEYTGLDYDWFKKLSAHFIETGLRVAAFITLPKEQNGAGPWPENDGMPTLEIDRKAALVDQARHLLATDLVTDIIISQQAATMKQLDELKEIINLESDLVFKLEGETNTTPVESKILDYGHFNRPDINSYFIRSFMTRKVFQDVAIPPKDNKRGLRQGDVVIPNDLFGRYKGEVHIITKNMPPDERKNYIGHISDFDMNLLEFATSGRKFQFIRGDKNE